MKPRVGVYLSEGMAARLAEAAKNPRATKSAVVEAALDRYFGSEGEVDDTATVVRHLAGLSRQLEELDRNLRIANETAALHARFHLAVTPPMPASEQRAACALGAERFEEFAAQVGRRVDLGAPLIRETVERMSATKTAPLTADEGDPSGTEDRLCEPDVQAPSLADGVSVPVAAVREDTATLGLRAVEAALFPDSATCRGIEEGEGAVPLQRSLPTWLMASRRVTKDPEEKRSLILRVFLPFVLGYYIAYLFRTINAVMAAPLATELRLGADDLGLLTSVYFVTFAAAQIPIGILLDRYGPRRVQSVLLLIAAVGSTLFAVSDHFLTLLLGRALIGLGVASAMTAGLKALVLWFPGDRVPLLNGLMVMLGALGAVTATLPADLLLDWFGWRELFGLFAGLTVASAVIIYLIVPEAAPVPSGAVAAGLKKVYADPRFWRLAPLSASCIGTAWALQGLWAAQWFKDVEGLDRAGVVFHLFAMAVALSLGAILLGIAADRLRRRGVGPGSLLGLVAAGFIATQFALILRLPLPSYLQWAVVAAVGAATVLSFAILAEYFPKQLAGRANGALNLFHIAAAFVVQYTTGVVLQHWTPQAGHYPEIAYQTAFALNLALQVVAWIWFMFPRVRTDSRRRLTREPYSNLMPGRR
ncbi:MFS transporter [Bradyrhizobium sp. SZCCHNR3015]|uniref:MFS transporter n=1 Tax=Bradyrhizobium sp. SZCCHNR3015 TaxID=3057395 RepID=UPI0029160932|nr:MFS transporter [Bradyrhizobium sp. SZCCHNR3015]